MVAEHPLDNVIRKIKKSEASAKDKANLFDKTVVVIDKSKKEILHKIPLFSGQNIVYFLVSNTNDASNIAEYTDISIDVIDFSKDRKLCISLAYLASCQPNKEKQLALALCSDNSPSSELEKMIRRWVTELTDGQVTEFIDNYLEQIEPLQNSLKKIAAEEIGLKVDFRLSLQQEKQIKPEKIGPTTITIYVSDSDDPLELQLQTELAIDNLARATSNLNSGWLVSLVKLTKEVIKNYFLEKTTLNQFYYELKDTIRNGLVQYLNDVLYDKGRKIGYLYLDSKIDLPPIPKELVEIQCNISCKVQRYTGWVSIENTLQMLPQDVRRYMSAQSPNLQTWVESKLERIIKPLLLDKKYADILLGFHDEAETIQKAMKVEAEAIGYTVQHIVSRLQQEHDDLLGNLEIQDEKSEYSTNVAGIKVSLDSIVYLKFKNLEKIEDYLNQTVDEIKSLIKKTINSTTRKTIRTIDPERFYMRFYEPKQDEKSVEQELKDEISEALVQEFGATVIRVAITPEQTDIIDYLRRLMGMIGSFQCEVPPLSGGEAVTFKGDFKVLSIEKNSWHTFQSAFQSMRESQRELLRELQVLKKKHDKIIDLEELEDLREELDEINQRIHAIENEIFGLDDIKSSIEKSVNSKLTTVDSQFLRYTDIKLLSTIEHYINKWAKKSVIEQYGLEVSIINLSRSLTQQEEYLINARKELDIAKVDEALTQVEARKQQRQKQLEMLSRKSQSQSDELDQLYKQRGKLIIDPDSDSDELEYLNNRIDSLEKDIISSSLDDAGDHLNILEATEKQQDKSALKFEDQMNLPPSKLE